MESYGIGVANVHISRHYDIASYCSVEMNSIPAIVAIVNRRVFHYHGPLKARSVRNFVKDTLPSWRIVKVKRHTHTHTHTHTVPHHSAHRKEF